MSDTWAAVLAISVAIMALVQIIYLIGVAIAAKKAMSAVNTTQQQVEMLAADVKTRVAAVSDRVNLVADDVRAVTARVQDVAASVSDGVHRVEESVRAAGQRVQQTVDQVPPGVKKGVPAGLAILAALRTVQQVRHRMKHDEAMRHERNGRDAYDVRDSAGYDVRDDRDDRDVYAAT
jgi:uncharacterized protein YoxC